MRRLKPNEIVREMRGIKTQVEFAAELGVTSVHLSQIETGRKAISLKIARKLVALDESYSLDDLLGRTGQTARVV